MCPVAGGRIPIMRERERQGQRGQRRESKGSMVSTESWDVGRGHNAQDAGKDFVIIWKMVVSQRER